MKKNKSYPKQWIKNPEGVTQSILKNTEAGNKSEQKTIDILKNNGIEIIGYPLEGSPVDKLLNIDLIIKDTNGVLGQQGKILTTQVKTAQNIIYDSEKHGFLLNKITIAKQNQIDVAPQLSYFLHDCYNQL